MIIERELTLTIVKIKMVRQQGITDVRMTTVKDTDGNLYFTGQFGKTDNVGDVFKCYRFELFQIKDWTTKKIILLVWEKMQAQKLNQ